MDDLISRQAAIDAVEKHACNTQRILDAISALPSAQPENIKCYEGKHGTHSDCGNNYDRGILPESYNYDPRADVYYLAEKIGIHQLYALVVELRGEPEPCEDAVSRKSILDKISKKDNWEKYDRYNIGLSDARRIVQDEPSVTPKRKTGKWIEYDSDEDKYDVIKCPYCKHTFTVDAYHWTDIGFVKDDFKFCPNCGADMRGKQEEAE